ncbi:helix-turn-helix transcriptional regulator [Prolixibacteraceae bacterium Z1-6]|uniref:Helix-turn-helix transcriptional regulator n=1 Tax=Draconibacterium aestuarii TaxID=2998507 RepID=A0A9X3FB06_9BACT|nr:helix-turn-helix transcriptional regulator [Prolixibacteraceae bacterium Z1-6]
MKNFDKISFEHKKILEDVGIELKRLRTKKTKSYTQLAEEIGISRNTYNSMELGKINFQLSTLLQVLDYHGVSIHKFFEDLSKK